MFFRGANTFLPCQLVICACGKVYNLPGVDVVTLQRIFVALE
jgi:hypothetical protein